MKLDSINIFSVLYDAKINAYNIAFEMSKMDYVSIIPAIKKNNEYQRNRIARKSSVQSLMKEDLKKGCLLPAITLSLSEPLAIDKENRNTEVQKSTIKHYIETHYDKIKILDGLQRTNILQDVAKELLSDESELFYQEKLRFEMYVGVNKFGILYRMLTLNTGQTAMTLRHQIEILYSDLLPEYGNENNIKLIKEVETGKKLGVGRYNFHQMVDGFESYIEGNEIPMDRFDIVNYVQKLEIISAKGNKKDLFEEFVNTYHFLVQHFVRLFEGVIFNLDTLSDEHYKIFDRVSPFANNIESLLVTAQSISAFGASINDEADFEIVRDKIQEILIDGDKQEAFDLLVIRLGEITKKARRLGEAQRYFLRSFFEYLFDNRKTTFSQAVENAFNITNSSKVI